MIAAVAYAPDGIVFKNDEVATLRAHCDLWRGASIDTTNAPTRGHQGLRR